MELGEEGSRGLHEWQPIFLLLDKWNWVLDHPPLKVPSARRSSRPGCGHPTATGPGLCPHQGRHCFGLDFAARLTWVALKSSGQIIWPKASKALQTGSSVKDGPQKHSPRCLPARCPFSPTFLGEGAPTKVDYTGKKGTLILTSLLEDLDSKWVKCEKSPTLPAQSM